MMNTERARLALAASLVVLAVAGCGGATTTAPTASGAPIDGGTAYFAEQPGSPPNYIFPLVSGQYFSVANVNQLQTLLYRPLYWFGDHDRAGVDYGLSLALPPVYSDGNRAVTITLRPARWSDGETVSARDVGFWINMVKAERDQWASYVPGGFPDNVRAWRALSRRTIRLELRGAYNPIWYTNNELSQITPLPLAWDRTSLREPVHSPARPAGAGGLPDATTAGARAVYNFLNAQSRDTAGYGASPIWSVVDGPWRLQSLTAEGEATFVPNPHYDGPNPPRIARFVELPFTSETAEFAVLRASSASGGPGVSGTQISVGWVPDTDLPQAGALRAQGYRLIAFRPQGFDYIEPNFNNPQAGPIFAQLYFRQAFQHLIDQHGWIHAYYGDLGVPTYSPVPAAPPNPYSDAAARVDPYPFSVAAARALLEAHGWRVMPDSVSTCERAGTGPGDCGRGIHAGQPLRFNLMYPSGLSYTDGAMTDLQSVAARVGIQLQLQEVTVGTIDSTIEACRPGSGACSWQLGQYGQPWLFEPDHYPTGEEIFQTGALGNVGSYSSPAVDRLIVASTRGASGRSPAAAQHALDAYADRVRTELPDFWQPSPGTMLTVQGNLHGAVPNAYGFISPEEWYFTR